MAVKLSKEWKQSLAPTDPQTFAVSVTLFDLLFKKVSSTITARSKVGAGFKLPHSVIVYDTTLYSTSSLNGVRVLKDEYINESGETLSTMQQWHKIGFDMARPYMDTRSRPLFLNKTNAESALLGDELTYSSDIDSIISVLKPTKLSSSDYYYSLQDKTGYAPGFKIYEEASMIPFVNTNDVYMRSTKYQESDDDWDPYSISVWGDTSINGDIVLCDENTTFEEKYLSDSIYKAFSNLCLNISSKWVWQNFIDYYDLNCTVAQLMSSQTLWTMDANTFEVTMSPLFEYLLKHCFIYFKCAFMADIVDYKDFKQSLNPDASVVHQNIIIGSGDHNRYDSAISDGKITEKASATRPYIPHVTPSVDLLSDQFVSGSTVEDQVQSLIDDSVMPESDIGVIPVEPLEDVQSDLDQHFTSSGRDTLPPGFFDPASRTKAADYNEVPVVTPKKGNGVFGGRLFSPTIDEIFYQLKEIIGGRAPDSETPDEIGYPKSSDSNPNSSDTRLKVAQRNFESNDGEVIGDPVWIEWQDVSGLSYNVTKWISNPGSFTYQLTSYLKTLSEKVSSIDITKAVPASNPYSLRELEALIRGLEYNLNWLSQYAEAIYATKEGGIKQFADNDELGAIEHPVSQNEVLDNSIYLSKNGTWQSVVQNIRIRVRDDEEY